ncbi:hypothetical protein L1281_000785 [Neisseria sp. HSC-16F19]|nr:hypothetical protein [Neisseria sp. HSC-16F19]MCP2040205.1 hypothetical protein [Neisseria sp. HSC-16F19]
MSTLRFYTCLLSLSLLAACSDTSDTSSPSSASATAASVPVAASAVIADDADKPQGLWAQFAWYRQRVENALKNADAQQADALFEQHQRDINTLLRQANREYADLLAEYSELMAASATHPRIGEFNALQSNLTAAGLMLRHPALEETDIFTAPDYYAKLFATHTSPAYRDYIHILARERATPEDWDVWGEQAAVWEGFVRQHGNSPLQQRARCRMAHKVALLLRGTGDSPSVDLENDTLLPEVRQAWTDYQSKHPHSALSPILAELATQTNPVINLETLPPIMQSLQLPDNDEAEAQCYYLTMSEDDPQVEQEQ